MGCRVNVDSLTHDERGYPSTEHAVSERMLSHLTGKIRRHAAEIWEWKELLMDDAEIAVVAYGSAARSAIKAVYDAREKGLKVGMVSLQTLWPFPDELIKRISRRVNAIVVPEINYGQYMHPVREHAECSVMGVNWAPGSLIPPNIILEAVEVVAA
jgi:2-oxoglutarate ferredoxin oxidoreductase subunit alpha